MTTATDTQSLYKVRYIQHVRIPMSDGVELDVNLYMPDAQGQFPVVFDYYPYRKDDLSAGGCASTTTLPSAVLLRSELMCAAPAVPAARRLMNTLSKNN
ncbi:MAG: hypothetical protein R3E79_06410 [Caldilineaceae bacterium]